MLYDVLALFHDFLLFFHLFDDHLHDRLSLTWTFHMQYHRRDHLDDYHVSILLFLLYLFFMSNTQKQNFSVQNWMEMKR
jgi:hypothetical protein